ncbi:hypothetical protein F5Y00DRAFT_224062 [Daldinia vernicosa]|uniref:uncharacterized protein n=1 Tax=Daldinia vernicosa TaxID=114800 RepID=UPI002008D689|nr:uncharacterized protein F5Y00DRAFT_224062 [Daldinia vernicosa]KAI0853946.1 hypothetical protein F5Y00DRAFT_224062 [Daldinia vernicosa]
MTWYPVLLLWVYPWWASPRYHHSHRGKQALPIPFSGWIGRYLCGRGRRRRRRESDQKELGFMSIPINRFSLPYHRGNTVSAAHQAL